MIDRIAASLGLPLLLGVASLVPWRFTPAARNPAPSGQVELHVLQDSAYHRARRVWVYTPPGYNPDRASPYPLLLAFDGEEYRDTMPLPAVLDSLLAAGAAPAFVAILIDDSTGPVRIADLGNAPRMVTFLAEQLVPWARKGWHVTKDPHRVMLTGSSAGGLGAAFAAFARPDLFGNVWSQSGAFWRGANASNAAPWEWLTGEVARSPARDVRFALDVGALEDHATLGGSGPNFLEASRRFRDALQARGYSLTSTEVPGGVHAPETWRTRLGYGIVALAGGWPRD
jgi:enterochelin esterase-like enzyme